MNYLDEIRERHSAFSIVGTPMVAGGLTLTFFAAPLFRFADPALLSLFGLSLAVGIFLAGVAMILEDPGTSRSTAYTAVITATIGIIGLTRVLTMAGDASARTDHQCGLLEIDMLSTKPARKDSRELYQTLACRQQSKGTLVFPSGGRFK